jgi:DNA polymerase-1
MTAVPTGQVLLEGDIHSENQRLAGLDMRDTAKTFIYAFLYGAGDEKIGKIVEPLASPVQQAKIGKELKNKFLKNLPALNKVIRDIQRQASRKFLVGLDGRRLFVRSKHAALNTDLQGMGATIANWWLVLIEDALYDAGLDTAGMVTSCSALGSTTRCRSHVVKVSKNRSWKSASRRHWMLAVN